MDLYTLTPTFLPNFNIDEFVSVIWTERYSSAGDCELVLPANETNLLNTIPGTYLALRGSKKIMELQTQSTENGLLTVKGRDLIGFLDERMAWFKNPEATEENDENVGDYTTDASTPGQIIAYAVEKSVIAPEDWTGLIQAEAALLWDDEIIPRLSLGSIDTTETDDPDEKLTVTIGPLYNSIAQVASKYKVGISLYLESADPIEGYYLKFTTYRGVDRSTGDDKITLSPRQDEMTDVKEIRSNDGYKNVCYVYYKGEVHVFYADPDLPIPTGMDRRVLITDPDKEPVGHKVRPHDYQPWYNPDYTYTVVDDADIDKFLAQNAKDALANHNYIQAIDGQTSPEIEFVYGTHYGLGDLIELESLTGVTSKARITEYIRSQDAVGEKGYPTISVETGEEEV